jgi:hypothetical protein
MYNEPASTISKCDTIAFVDALEWLLNSDPALRWQAMRDLTGASPAAIASERARVCQHGICAGILNLQQKDGSWRRDGAPVWLTTLFTMQLLRASGIDPSDPAVEAAAARIERGLRWNNQGGRWDLRAAESGGNTLFQGEVEPCINGGALAVGSYFGRPNESLMRRLLSEQLEDGGWNCEAPRSSRSSFHTTLCVLEGLIEYERAVGSVPDVTSSRKRGEEYLLERRLYRRLSTGNIANKEFMNFAFLPRYRFDILRGLDYFQSTKCEPDARMADAVGIVRSKMQQDGRWLLDASYDEALPVALNEAVNMPSRWNTLRALRVLRWYEQSSPVIT